METKSLLIGIISFIAGGLLVSIAATTFEKDKIATSDQSNQAHKNNSLVDKTGNDFDKAFIEEMIVHHEGAIDMAKLAEKQAEHIEIKQLSKEIISAQDKEISLMKHWQVSWGYSDAESSQPMSH